MLTTLTSAMAVCLVAALAIAFTLVIQSYNLKKMMRSVDQCGDPFRYRPNGMFEFMHIFSLGMLTEVFIVLPKSERYLQHRAISKITNRIFTLRQWFARALLLAIVLGIIMFILVFNRTNS